MFMGRGRFPALELVLSIAGHGMVGAVILVFESWFPPAVEAAADEDQDNKVVYVTQVKLSKQADYLPDKASQRPREPSQATENTPTENTPPPTTPTETPVPRETQPTAETASDSPSYEELTSDLPTLDLPEGPTDREETSAEGSSHAVLDGSEFGADSAVGRWMAECGEVMRAVIFVADHITSDMNSDAFVIVKVDIDDSGSVNHPELHQTSGSYLFDRAIVNGLKRRPVCPPRPPEAREFSHRTRIRVPVRESD